MEKPERIAKVMAAAGLCSRRDAERWIAAGRVSVDGKVIDSPALNVNIKTQKILVDDVPLKSRDKTRVWLYHKPTGLITSHKDPEGRGTVFDSLPKNLPRVVSVGRLDYNSEGLLLLTNDGELAQKLMLPSSGWLRRYRVRVYGEISDAQIAALKKGVTIEDERFGSIVVTRDAATTSKKNQWLNFAMKEGKNREIRRVCAFLGLEVSRLIRIAYGEFELGTLAEGAVVEVSSAIVTKLLEKIHYDRKLPQGSAESV